MLKTLLPQLFSLLFNQSPLIVAYIIALVFCATRWRIYPRPAQLAFLGTSFLLITTIAQPTLTLVISTQFPANSASQLAEMHSMVGFISSVIRGTGFGFLVGAVFIKRADALAAFAVLEEHAAGRA